MHETTDIKSPPHLQRREPLFIIKIGGNIIDDEKKLRSFLTQFASITAKKILVHGGGKMATKIAEDGKVPQQLIEGRRVTDVETLKIVTMVYAGSINKNIVAQLQELKCNAMGLCGADGNLVKAHKRGHGSIDYGFVGDVDEVNSELLHSLLCLDLTLVVAPITHNGQGQLLNTNADTMAQEIAKAMSATYDTYLIYSFEKEGVLLDLTDEDSVIKTLNEARYNELKSNNLIFAGMIPKLDNAFLALRQGVKKVVIGKAEKLKELMEGNSGTTISNE